MDRVNITIVGAGIIGLAIAKELSKRYTDIIVLEKHPKFGQETSSRNSEVIHSGIYYPPGSLKASLCVEGAKLLYEYCNRHSIPHSRLGKFIVATENEELYKIEELYDNGISNGVEGLSIIDGKDVTKIEPYLHALSALYSANTGIIDSHSLMEKLYRNAISSNVLFSFNSEANYIEKIKAGYLIGIRGDDYKFLSKVVINSAGLHADQIAQLAGIDIDSAGYRLKYCKGSYFYYAKPSPIKKLVYPVPHENLVGLGIHATLDLAGRLRFGPDVEYVESVNYRVDDKKLEDFYISASKMIKGLDKSAFLPDMAGIRPKLHGLNERGKDFIIKEESNKGLEGFINLIGIESPGLTASLAIAKMVKKIVDEVMA